MARSARLKLALLALGVAAGHVVALEWLAREADAIAALPLMAPPMVTRMLKPAEPPAVVAQAQPAPPAKPKPRVATAALLPASSPQELARERERTREKALEHVRELDAQRLAQEREREREAKEQQRQAQAAAAAASAASAPQAVASVPAEAASAPLAAASAPSDTKAGLERWPPDTRLSYDVTGNYRGPLSGNARVLWQREGGKYQVQLEIQVAFLRQTLTSQGQVTPDGLLPRAYEEARTGGKRRSTQLGDQVVTLDKGDTVPRPAGVQDTASQFVELSQRFATGKERLEVGRTVTVWLARPGGVDQWIYDVAERETLRTAMGEVEAFHLKPRPPPAARGNITAEMWFAPSLQYLPVKIRVLMGNEAYLDLMVDHIDQK